MNTNYLMFANIVFWLGLGLYLLFIGKKQKNISNKLDLMDNNDE